MEHEHFEEDVPLPAEFATARRGTGGLLAGALLAAAVSAGMALLYAPAAGPETRKRVKRRLSRLEKEALRSRPGRQAQRRIRMLQRRLDVRRHEQERARRRAMLIAAVVGAGIAVLLAPGPGAAARRKLGESARRAGEAAAKLRRPRGAGGESDGDWRQPTRPVRSVQELGRDESDVF